MKVFRLNHVLKASQELVVKSVKNGKVSHSLMRVEIGKTYKVGNYDEQSLKERTTQVRYTKEAEEYLKKEGVNFEVTMCKTCGGKKKKLVVPTVEIFEVDPEKWEEIK